LKASLKNAKISSSGRGSQSSVVSVRIRTVGSPFMAAEEEDGRHRRHVSAAALRAG
jgi:hypothetical protein